MRENHSMVCSVLATTVGQHRDVIHKAYGLGVVVNVFKRYVKISEVFRTSYNILESVLFFNNKVHILREEKF